MGGFPGGDGWRRDRVDSLAWVVDSAVVWVVDSRAWVAVADSLEWVAVDSAVAWAAVAGVALAIEEVVAAQDSDPTQFSKSKDR